MAFMDTNINEAHKEKKQGEAETPHKHAAAAVTMIASCAFGAFVLGALIGAPWPGAVVACGLAATGVGVAYILMRRA